ncbi:DNA primase, partial [Patescibacteria group bacterium]
MTSSPIDEIKNRLDVVEVIGSYIKLQKTGINYRAVCPFHSEKKPSFFVSPARQIWHCFGCSSGGDLFKFVMQIEGVEFGDALRMLAKKAGVELKPMKKESVVFETERQRLYEINELAVKFFEKQLESSIIGKEAKKYLLDRKISKDSIKNWRLGYSPETWQGLLDFLALKGYKQEEVERAGLAIKSDKGSFYDRFRGRIMFPIFDLNSQIIAFGARVFKEKDNKEIAKYINTPATILYDKSRVLYGLNRAKIEIKREDCCVLVEGYIDVIMCSQAGYQNIVATSGTALTPFQLKILKRYSENLLTAFDMDVAGDTATKRGIDLAQTLGFNVGVITMGEKDPADVISENSEQWGELLKKSKSILSFYFENTFSKLNKKTAEGKREISKILLPVIKRIQNQIEKSHWIQELSKKLGTKESNIIEELEKVKLTEDVFGLEKEEIFNLPQKPRRELLEERFLVLLLTLKSPEALSLIKDEDMVCLKPGTQDIVKKMKNDLNEGKDFDFKEFSPEISSFLDTLSLQAEIEEAEEKEAKSEILVCLREIQRCDLRKKMDEISQNIKVAEADGDNKKTESLRNKFHQLG